MRGIHGVMLSVALGAVSAFGQSCTLSPDTVGGPQYNQPQPFITNYFGSVIPIAWPQSSGVFYIEFSGIYDTYPTSFPADYQAALPAAYSNWETSASENNSGLTYNYYGTSDIGLSSAGGQPNPNFQPWHIWTVVNQSDLPNATTLAITDFSYQNYGTAAQAFWRLGTAYTRVTSQMSIDGDSFSWEASTFAHEIGHTMALADCEQCLYAPGGTIMSYASSPDDPHSPSNITGPQYCDNQQTRQTAYPQ
jgi:hypothetical protein